MQPKCNDTIKLNLYGNHETLMALRKYLQSEIDIEKQRNYLSFNN